MAIEIANIALYTNRASVLKFKVNLSNKERRLE